MKKKICFIIFVLLLVVFLIKYFVSSYKIKYNLNDFDVTEIYENGKYYFEISNDDLAFNILFYKDRKLSKKLIKGINIFEGENYNCLDVNLDFYAHYPICYDKDNNLIHFSLISDKDIVEYLLDLGISSTSLITYDDEFYFTNSLDSNQHIAVWKYDGFYLLDDSGVKSIDMFDNDRYSNTLSYLYKDIIFLPNYDEDLFFTKFILFDIIDGKYEIYNSDFEISYDSYISGTNGNNIYLYDRKNECLYEVNIKKGKIECVGDAENGFVKYENGKRVKALLKEYDEEHIMYFDDKQCNNIAVDGLNYFYVYNNNILTKFKNDENFSIVNIFNNDIYYLSNDDLYVFNPIYGHKLILHYFELNFNDSNRIFIYNK